VAKKGRQGLVILHDCSKILDGSTEELRSALLHKKEKLSIASVHILDPATVLSLFKRVTDEVDATFFFNLTRVLITFSEVPWYIGHRFICYILTIILKYSAGL
jgi:hypothetical protein